MYRGVVAVVAPVGQAAAIVARAAQQVVDLAHHPTDSGCPFKFRPDTGLTFDKLSGIPKRDDLGSV
jgi:hypothetical protein